MELGTFMRLPFGSAEDQGVTQIHVDRTQVLQEAGETRFVMYCRVDGECVERGSVLSLPISAGMDMTIPVNEVVQEDGGGVVIVVSCDDADEADFLSGLDLAGEILNYWIEPSGHASTRNPVG